MHFLTNFVDPFLSDARSGGTAEECGDATGNNIHYYIHYIYIYIIAFIVRINALSSDFFLFFFALKLSIGVTLSKNLDVIDYENLFIEFICQIV